MLTVIPTPIGNLGDITLRALEALRSCDLVAAEDTRHTGLLLKHYEISKPQISLHEHNEAARSGMLIKDMLAGRSIALVSDAGMPAISDPGGRLIHSARQAGLSVTVLPGPCAALTALVGSGLDTERFCFLGFLPHKAGRRQRELAAALARQETSVFYESPHRLGKSLAQLAELDPERQICVARELTKHFEEYRNGRAVELLAHYTEHPPKGEICLLIAAAPERRRATTPHSTPCDAP